MQQDLLTTKVKVFDALGSYAEEEQLTNLQVSEFSSRNFYDKAIYLNSLLTNIASQPAYYSIIDRWGLSSQILSFFELSSSQIVEHSA